MVKSGQLVQQTESLLQLPLARLVGPKTAQRMEKLQLYTGADLLYFAPRTIRSWTQLGTGDEMEEGKDITLVAEVIQASVRSLRSRPGYMLTATLDDGQRALTATFFGRHRGLIAHHEKQLRPGVRLLFAGKLGKYRDSWQLTHPLYEDVSQLNEKQLQERAAKPVVIYPQTAQLPTWITARAVRSLLEMLHPNEVPNLLQGGEADALPFSWAQLSTWDALHQLHLPATESAWYAARQRLALDEALITQSALEIARRGYAAKVAPKCQSKGDLSTRLEKNLPFTLTPSQEQAQAEIMADLADSTPMQRLLQGDVGAGKTVVAALAMARAVDSGVQAVILAPTEILANQHLQTLCKLFGEAQSQSVGGVPILSLSRSLTAPQKRSTLAVLAAGKPSILVATHAALSDNVQLPNLGLLVVDEQHRFGVEQREILREKGETVPHLLLMTATPIPRTVAMSVFGDLEISTLAARPQRHQNIATHLVPAENRVWMDRLWRRAAEEVAAGGHVYVVCPRIDPSDAAGDLISALDLHHELQEHPALHGLQIGLLHGRMKADEKAAAMEAFISGRTPILVSTTVVEVGVDDPAATMMVIMDAQQFGLSALHQLRGRVGRGTSAAVCMAVHKAELGSESLQRLKIFAETSDGFALAEADVKLRREGDVLGVNQAGYSSRLRFLRVTRDAEIISQARKIAAQVLADDPKLESHPELAEAINRALSEQQRVQLTRN